MRIRSCPAMVLIVTMTLGSMPVAAQDAGTVGITMGYPAAIGLLVRASDKVAIRPELNFSGGSGESETSFFASTSDSWAIGTGVSVLFYMKKYDRLQTYVSPRFTYSHTSNSSDIAGPVSTPETNASSNSYGFAGLFGAEQSLGDKFAVFGEVGFGFSHSTSKTSLSPTKLSSNTWGTRAGVGVVFFP